MRDMLRQKVRGSMSLEGSNDLPAAAREGAWVPVLIERLTKYDGP